MEKAESGVAHGKELADPMEALKPDAEASDFG